MQRLKMKDITLLTCRAYFKPNKITPYIANILKEEQLLKAALEKQGLSVEITYWDNPSYDWSATKAVLFRTIWDYFERFDEFWKWLVELNTQTKLINSFDLIELSLIHI